MIYFEFIYVHDSLHLQLEQKKNNLSSKSLFAISREHSFSVPLSTQSFSFPLAPGGQFRPEVSAPLCQRGVSPDVQKADQVGEGQRGHEGRAGQVQIAIWRHQYLTHCGGGERIDQDHLKVARCSLRHHMR